MDKRKQVDPLKIWTEYQDGVTYKQGLDLFYTVNRNNDFINDDQWKGVNAPDLDKPVFNIIAPAVNYYMAILISDSIAVDFGAKAYVDPITGPTENPSAYPPDMVARVLHQSTLRFFDTGRLMFHARQFLRNCAVDGDSCFYAVYSDEKKSVDIEVLDNTNVIFGDTSTTDVQHQPYIIAAYRRLTRDVKAEAKANGVADWDAIKPDYDDSFQNSEVSDSVHNYTTVLVKFWRSKETGTIHYSKSTIEKMVQDDVDLGYTLYPFVWQSWMKRKNSYHGISPVSGRIPNQIFVNKAYAMSMRHVINFAHPKILYDETRLPEGWDNDVNSAIAVEGNPTDAVFAGFNPPNLGDSGTHLADSVMQHTENSLGATKSALGQERPYNTSAIMAQQRASSMPLDYQRFDFHDSVEALVRIFIDMITVDYGVRYIELDNGVQGWFDYSQLKDFSLNMSVDVGAGSYWSEANALQVLRDMMEFGMIVDPVVYLEALPEGYFKDKSKALDAMRQAQAQAQMQAQQMSQMQPGIGGQNGPNVG